MEKTRSKKVVAFLMALIMGVSSFGTLPVFAASESGPYANVQVSNNTDSSSAASSRENSSSSSSSSKSEIDASSSSKANQANEEEKLKGFDQNPDVVAPGEQGEQLNNPYYVYALIQENRKGAFNEKTNPNTQRLKNGEMPVFEKPSDVIPYHMIEYKGIDYKATLDGLFYYKTSDQKDSPFIFTCKSVTPQYNANQYGTYKFTYHIERKDGKYQGVDKTATIQITAEPRFPAQKKSKNKNENFLSKIIKSVVPAAYAYGEEEKNDSSGIHLYYNGQITEQVKNTSKNSTSYASSYHVKATSSSSTGGLDVPLPSAFGGGFGTWCSQHGDSSPSSIPCSGTIEVMSAQNNTGFAKLLKWKQSHNWDGYQVALACDAVYTNTQERPYDLFSHDGIRSSLAQKDKDGVAQLLDNASSQSIDLVNDIIIEFTPNDSNFQTTFGYVPAKFEQPRYVIPKVTVNKKGSLGDPLPGATFKLSSSKDSSNYDIETSDSNGYVQLSLYSPDKLDKPGDSVTYTLTETGVPEGYSLPSNPVVKTWTVSYSQGSTDKNNPFISEQTATGGKNENGGDTHDGYYNTTPRWDFQFSKFSNATDDNGNTHHNERLTGAKFNYYIWSESKGGYSWAGDNAITETSTGTYALNTSGLTGEFKKDWFYTSNNKGRFVVTETQAPTGFKMPDSDKCYVSGFSPRDSSEKVVYYVDNVLTASGGTRSGYNNGTISFNFTSYNDGITNTPYKFKAQLVKKDNEDQNANGLSGAQFTVLENIGGGWRNVQCGATLTDCGGGEYISNWIHYTQANQGRFRIVETKAPTNYVRPEYADWIDVYGQHHKWSQLYWDVTLDADRDEQTVSLGTRENGSSLETYEDWNGGSGLIVPNAPQKARIRVDKQGPVLISASQSGTAETAIGNHTTFHFTDKSLSNATFSIYAPDGYISAAGVQKYYPGEKIATITTDKLLQMLDGNESYNNGNAVNVYGEKNTTNDLYVPCRYKIVEDKAPDNYTMTRSESDRTQYVTLSYRGDTVSTYTNTSTFHNDHPQLSIHTSKKDYESKYQLQGSIIGLYAGEDIYQETPDQNKGSLIAHKDQLIQTVSTDASGNATFSPSEKLPINYKYYIKEIQAPFGYYHSEYGQTGPFENLHINDNKTVIEPYGTGATPLSPNYFDSEGKWWFTFNWDRTNHQYTDQPYGYTNSSNLDSEKSFTYSLFRNRHVYGHLEVQKFDEETGGPTQGDATFEGATYALYAKGNIQNPDKSGTLYTDGEKVIESVADKNGKAVFEDKKIVLGTYTLKEIKAPNGYFLDKSTYTVTFTYQGQDKLIVNPSSVISDKNEKGIRIGPDGTLNWGWQWDTNNANRSYSPELVKRAPFSVHKFKQAVADGQFINPYANVHLQVKLASEVCDGKFKYVSDGSNIGWQYFADGSTTGKPVKTTDLDSFTLNETKWSAAASYGDAKTKNQSNPNPKDYKVEASDKDFANNDIVTDSKGEAQSVRLPYGVYVVREVKQDEPEKYQYLKSFLVCITDDSTTVETGLSGQLDSNNLYLLDQPVKYFLRINKYDPETKNMIALAQTTFRMETFDVSKNQWIPYTETYGPGDIGMENVHSTWTTDNRGTLSLVNPLPVAKYRVIEIAAPTGYLLDKTPAEFSIPATNTVVVLDRDKHPVIYINKYDKPVKGKIAITKTGQLLDTADTKTSPASFVYKTENLAGATFELRAAEDIHTPDNQPNSLFYQRRALVSTKVTDSKGQLVFDNLPLGSYTVKEIKAPTGQVIDDAQTKTVTLSYKDNATAVIEDSETVNNKRPQVKLSVVKKEMDDNGSMSDGVALTGAVFGLYSKNAIYSETNPGQVLVPAGAKVSEGISGEHGLVDFTANADLPAAVYYAKEETPPQGYSSYKEDIPLDASYVNDMTPVIELSKDIGDKKLKVEVSKKDSETGTPLFGATYQVFEADKDGKATTNLIDEWVSAKDVTHYIGQATPVHLTAGKTYVLHEKKAPFGYKLADDVPFTVKNIDDVQTVAMQDAPLTGTFKLYKTGQKISSATALPNGNGYGINYENLPIEGVSFEIYAQNDIMNPDGTGIVYHAGDKVTRIVSGVDGVATAKHLYLGQYYAVETDTVKPYVLDTSKIEFSVKENNPEEDQSLDSIMVVNNKVNNLRQIRAKMIKQDSEDSTPLSGAVFGLYTASDIKNYKGEIIIKAKTLLGKATSDKNGEALFEGFPCDISYYVEELKAPVGYSSIIGGVKPQIQLISEYDKADKVTDVSVDSIATLKDDKTRNSFVKQDITTGETLDGAVLQVLKVQKDANGNYQKDHDGNYVTSLIDSWISKKAEKHEIQKLEVGATYILREVTAPQGYVGYRASSDVTKEANKDSNKITEETMFVVKDTGLEVAHAMKDQASVGQLVISKKGEILTNYTAPTGIQAVLNQISGQFGYITGNLQNAKFTMIAAEDILSPDGSGKYLYHLGDKVTEVTTDCNGVGQINNIPLGKYSLYESEAPKGFALIKDVIPVQFGYAGQEIPVVTANQTVKDERQKVEITVKKTSNIDSENKYLNKAEDSQTESKNLSGAIFGIYADEDIYAPFIDANGKSTSVTVNPYTKDNTVSGESKSSSAVSEQGSSSSAASEKVVPSSSSASSSAPAPKASTSEEQHGVLLLKKGTLIETATTNEDGIAKFESNLPVNHKFVVKEIKAPTGYHLSDKVFEIDTTSKDSNKITLDFDSEVKDAPTVVKITKYDITNKKELEGAKLQVLDETGKAVDEWTSGTESHYIKHLETGKTYKLVEQTPASGYATAEAVTFTVLDKDKDGKTVAVQSVDMYDKPITVAVHKTAVDSTAELKGAKLSIKNSVGSIVDSWTSDGTAHVITKLPIGKYTLTEDAAPAGYVKAEDVPFTVTDTEKVQDVFMKDDFTKADFDKEDLTSGKSLVGARLVVKDSSNKVVESWISNGETHRIEKIPVGTYTLTENEAPAGYIKAADVHFTIADTSDAQRFVMLDDYTKLDVSKVEITHGAELPGALMEVKSVKGDVIDQWTSGLTPHRIDRIPAGEYILSEMQAPTSKGYVKANDVHFTVKTSGEIQKVQMKDDFTKLSIAKIDSQTRAAMSGATLELYDANDKLIKSWVSGTESATFSYLPVGNYTLHEAKAPKGYYASADIKFKVNETAQTQKVTMVDSKQPGVVTGIEDSRKNGILAFAIIIASAGVAAFMTLKTLKRKKK